MWAPAARASSSVLCKGLPVVRFVVCPIARTSSFSDDTSCWPLMTTTLAPVPLLIVKLVDSDVIETEQPA